jgi:hypothetical protein
MAPRKKSAGDSADKAKKPQTRKDPKHLEKMQKVAAHARSCIKPENLGGAAGQTLYKPEYARIARVMCKRGATNPELGEAFGVGRKTIQSWRNKHDEFDEALKIFKGEFDDRVERAFAERAVGYEYDAERVFWPAGAKEPVIVTYREHVPPDVAAAKAWLCSRRRDQWKDRWEITGADGEPLVPIIALLKEINGGTASLVALPTAEEDRE